MKQMPCSQEDGKSPQPSQHPANWLPRPRWYEPIDKLGCEPYQGINPS